MAAFIGERQRRAPQHLQARVGISGRTINMASATVGAALASAATEFTGLREIYVVMAVLTLVVGARRLAADPPRRAALAGALSTARPGAPTRCSRRATAASSSARRASTSWRRASSSVALPWLILDGGGSTLAAGLVFTLAVLPYVVFGLPAGVVGDRYPRRRTMWIAHAVQARLRDRHPARGRCPGTRRWASCWRRRS